MDKADKLADTVVILDMSNQNVQKGETKVILITVEISHQIRKKNILEHVTSKGKEKKVENNSNNSSGANVQGQMAVTDYDAAALTLMQLYLVAVEHDDMLHYCHMCEEFQPEQHQCTGSYNDAYTQKPVSQEASVSHEELEEMEWNMKNSKSLHGATSMPYSWGKHLHKRCNLSLNKYAGQP